MVGGMLMIQKTLVVILLLTAVVELWQGYRTGQMLMPLWMHVIQWIAMAGLFVNSFRIRAKRD